MANSEPITPDSVKRITTINALGTVNVNEAFYEIAGLDFAIVNVASMAAHMMPPAMYPTNIFRCALRDQVAFLAKARRTYRLAPERPRPGMAYSPEQDLRPVVLHVPSRLVRIAWRAHLVGLARLHRHRDGGLDAVLALRTRETPSQKGGAKGIRIPDPHTARTRQGR
jgi:NAD(P)-dependent dehydrogenase (short-subunit alcohol dehydrogenase family)